MQAHRPHLQWIRRKCPGNAGGKQPQKWAVSKNPYASHLRERKV